MAGRERLGFYCPRINYLKMFGPVLQAIRARRFGLTPILIIPVPPLITYRAKNRRLAAGLHLTQVRAQVGEDIRIAPVDSAQAFLHVIDREGVRVVVTGDLKLPDSIMTHTIPPSRRNGVRWCTLGYIQEEILQILEDGPELLAKWDLPTTLSAAGVEFLVEVLRRRGHPTPEAARRLVPIGFVELDQVADFSRDALRDKYGIPRNARVVYFSTAARYPLRGAPGMDTLFYRELSGLGRAGTLVRRLWGGRWVGVEVFPTYRDILGTVRSFARRHGALLIGKTRDKHRDPWFTSLYVDRLISDGEYFPFRTLELIYLADMYVGMPTTSVVEAAFLGRRMVNIFPFPLETYEPESFMPMREEFYARVGGLWNAPGLSWSVFTFRHEDWGKFRQWGESGKWETTVDPEARTRVVARSVGFDDFKASHRFLDLVEAALRA